LFASNPVIVWPIRHADAAFRKMVIRWVENKPTSQSCLPTNAQGKRSSITVLGLDRILRDPRPRLPKTHDSPILFSGRPHIYPGLRAQALEP